MFRTRTHTHIHTHTHTHTHTKSDTQTLRKRVNLIWAFSGSEIHQYFSQLQLFSLSHLVITAYAKERKYEVALVYD